MKVLEEIFRLLFEYKRKIKLEKKKDELRKQREEKEKWAWAEEKEYDWLYSNYKEKKLFTKSEQSFLNELLEYTKNADIKILSKVRLADIVEVKNTTEFKEKRGLFNKIKSKHIDFIIVNPAGQIKCLIELDGWNHITDLQTRENDKFKNELFEVLWLDLIRFKVWKYDFWILNKYLS